MRAKATIGCDGWALIGVRKSTATDCARVNWDKPLSNGTSCTMTVESSEISAEKAGFILAKNEGQFCDMKAKEIAPAKMSRTLSAFANADGGELFVGIAQSHSGSFVWSGFAKEEDANAHLKIVDDLFPVGSITRCAFITCPSHVGCVLHIEVEKTNDIRKATDGTAYLRRGAQNLPQDTDDKIERLKLNKGLKSFEDHTVNVDFSDITNSKAIIEFILDAVPSAEPEAWLRKQKLIVNNMPVVAGLLLFSDEPQTSIPKSAVKIYRYKTKDEIGSRDTLAFDPISMEGNLYEQIYASVNKIKEITEKIPLVGEDGFKNINYPTEAIHEIVTNAVIHRDYSINDDVHVRIFDNRIEVQSPGTLPGHVTVRNILEERAARNPKIVRLLNKFRNPPNKDVGEGLNTAFEAMRKLKLKDPIVSQSDNSVIVKIRHEILGTPEQIITDYLKDNREINNSIARSICFIGSENSMKRIFQKMISAKLIERIPERPLNKTGYVRGKNFPK